MKELSTLFMFVEYGDNRVIDALDRIKIAIKEGVSVDDALYDVQQEIEAIRKEITN